MSPQTIFSQQITRPSIVGLLWFNIFLFLAFIFSVGIAVAALYHALVFSISNAWGIIFIYTAPIITLMSAVAVVYSRQPVHSLLSLITVFFLTIAFYIHAGAEFLAFLFLIVYVGAIAILFLFVIMLLQIKETNNTLSRSGALIMSAPVIIFVVIGLEDVLVQGFIDFTTISVSDRISGQSAIESLIYFINYQFTDIFLFSTTLYTQHCFLIVLAAILLLTAMLGAIVLAMSASDNTAKIK